MGWSAIILVIFCQRAGGIFLSTSNETVSVPLNFPLSIPFAEVIGVREEDGDLSPLHLAPLDTHRFIFNATTGQVSFRTPLDSESLEHPLRIPFFGGTRPVGALNVVFTNNSVCHAGPQLCFESFTSSPVVYKIPESVAVGTKFARLLPLVPYHLCTDVRVQYRLSSGDDVVDVDLGTGYLYLRSELDAEKTSQHSFEVSCAVHGLQHNLTYKMAAVIRVLDVDDNAPYLQDGKSHIVDVDASHFKQGKSWPFDVLDDDSIDVNDIEVRIENDEFDLFEVRDTVTLNIPSKGAILKQADVVPKTSFSFPDQSYNFSVVFEDVSLRNSEINKVVFHVRVHNRTIFPPPDYPSQYYVSINKQAAQYSRVFQPFRVDPNIGYTFQLADTESSEKLFAITPKTGIIYLYDDKGLKKTQQTSIYLNISWKSATQEISHSIVLINLTENYVNSTNEHCDPMCSVNDNEARCVSRCGRGATTGQCKWRSFGGNNNLTTEYATCSPDFATCPDKECDELEDMVKSICPQDCAKNVQGEVSPSSNRGIDIARGTCTCSGVNSCMCLRLPKTSYPRPSSRPQLSAEDSKVPSIAKTSTQSYLPSRKLQNDPQDPVHHASGVMSTTACGQGCIAFIFMAVSCTLVSCMVFVVCHRLRSNKKRSEKHKHVGSRMSLSVVPSDYVDERSLSAPDSQAISDYSTSSKAYYDVKWEIPRENLIIEQILGEGEFGKVMKAQAWGISGLQAYSTVAVKMLKSNGTMAEQQDLISEFNMLKEVCHPNVIRLLAACTQKGGPLYVIVEYAEYGALRTYLRKCRRLEFDCNCNMHTVDNPMYLLDRKDLVQSCALTQKELLSFAWQISKGMAYLSDMKLVHRDLAARNVLLATGNVIKISDFGLSRDVYEGDTYLKKSKGRVPVKWMALESLEDHIYTSKSDVWSFGVVLWEIVTLGASPYPGVTPERLFQLLKAGYRMERPPSCSLELYKIMKLSWKENPHERPAFKELVQRFDCMLQETVEYLDLSLAPSARCRGELRDTNFEVDQLQIADEVSVSGEPEYGNIHLLVEETSSEENISLLEIDAPMQEQRC